MTSETVKQLRMFAGPNGSGKTSLAQRLGKEFSSAGLFRLHHFINADELQLALQRDTGVDLVHFGISASTENVRDALLRAGRLTESHPFVCGLHIEGSHLAAPREACDAYAAAALADFLRDEILAAGRSFSFETVMSHQSKADFFARAKALGYRTYLYFIATETPQLNIHRVKNRVELGGHQVPEGKVIERYRRSLALVRSVLPHAYRAFLFDNSHGAPVWIAQQTPEGKLKLEVSESTLPEWFNTWVAGN